jgi:hypothetical protein
MGVRENLKLFWKITAVLHREKVKKGGKGERRFLPHVVLVVANESSHLLLAFSKLGLEASPKC